ncbi:MAG TPA: protein-disulfide reductase DsbD domain-containing protein [Casimicrobiaceae bacterium]|nr:protein-disulfide reductase DsbD domain-containing protein [Casimicrobiaceae bacterium]
MLRPLRIVIAAALAAAAAGVLAAPVRTAHVEAELVAAETALVPGSPSTVALRLKMDRGWHTYWRNPGDSGLPTTLAWKLPAGMSAGPIEWPAPRALPVGPLVNYGYEGEVFLLTEIAVARDLAGQAANLAARADWLVCKEICIPEGADLALTLPVAASATADPRWTGPIASARAALPRPLEGWTVVAAGHGAEIELSLRPRAPTDLGEVHFFPYSEGKIEASGRQTLTRKDSTLALTLPVASQRVGDFTRVAGVLTSSKGFSGFDAAAIDVPLTGAVVAGAPPAGAATAATALPIVDDANRLSFWVALVFALAGGALLNLMPCVFPVLSLKVLGFASHGGGTAGMRAHGLAFAGGVIASFVALAVLLVALRAAGAQLGWGFQLQSPAIIVALAILFFVFALNLSGVFEVGQLLPSAVSTWSPRNAYVNDALAGLVAVVVASPCSAPFMGAALGYALAQNNAATLAIFAALGVGMALPYLALAFFPAWRRKLPKPGPWMERLRQVLAFPLYGTVIWLAWVLSMQLDNDAVARLLAVLLLIAFALWAWQTMRAGGARGWGVAATLGLAAAALVGWPVAIAVTADNAPPPKALAAEKGPWQDFTPERVRDLTGAGRAVFVDFTAAWCVTCQVNKIALNSDAVRAAFAQKNVALLRADWTRRDPVIGQALAALGRNGIPVYVLYRPGREPLLLPEVLQKSTITDALATL